MQADHALARARWVKATASSGDQGCVEVAALPGGRVAVRDSKNPGTPPHILTRHHWSRFLHAAKNGHFTPPAR